MSVSYPGMRTLTADVIGTKGSFAVGCKVSEGKIIPAPHCNLKTTTMMPDLKFAFFAERAGKYCIYAGESLYYSTDLKTFLKSGLTFPATYPFIAETGGKNSVPCVVGDEYLMQFDTATNTRKALKSGICGGVTVCDRVFTRDVNDGYKIWWSGDDGLLSWEDGINGSGYTYINQGYGKICDLIVFNGEIAVICERGIALFSVHGNQENFKMKYAVRLYSDIIPHTAAVIEDKLYFFKEDGLYSFDGNTAEKVRHYFENDILKPYQVAVYGKYIAVAATSSKIRRPLVYFINPVNGEAFSVDVNAKLLLSADKFVIFNEGKAYFLKEGGEYTYQSGKIDFGVRGRKILRSIHLGNLEPVTLMVACGNRGRVIENAVGYCRIEMPGDDFYVGVVGTDEIDGMTAIAEVIDGD